MKKGLWVFMIVILIIIVGIIVGVNFFNKEKIVKWNQTEDELSKTKNELEENIIRANIELVTTVSVEEKTSPYCLCIFKTYYPKCEHTSIERKALGEELVNKTREEIEEIYDEWNIVTFRNDEILFYREKEGMCNEHFLLKEDDGDIVVYVLDENNKATLRNVTGIITTYLPQEDIEKFKEGIRIDGQDKLNQFFEDYE